MHRENKILLIIFFPITAYLFIGTSLFFLVTKLDELAEILGNYSEFPGLEDYSSNDWHDVSIWLTVFFPITWPVIFIWISCVLLYSLVAAMLRLIYEFLKILWEFVIDLVTAIWEWVTEAVKAIWEWTVDSIEYIWETITSIFR
jgi:hypothetical protein